VRTVTKKYKLPPFRLDPNSTASLSDQMTDGFRQAILEGYYREGEVLPPIRELEKFFGVSLFVPREVLSRLSREGLVNPRPHLGSIVMKRNVALRLGHILLVIPDVPGAYYANAFGDVLHEKFAAAGYTFTRVTVLRNASGEYDLSSLDVELNRSIDLAILLFDAPVVAKRLSRSGKPFVAVGQEFCKLKGCVGNVYRPRNGATEEFFRHCRNSGVKSVLIADWNGEGFSVLEGVKHDGIRVEQLLVPTYGDKMRPVDIQLGALREITRFLRERKRLPDLLFMAEESVIVGALTAVLSERVEVPKQMKLAVWSHLGGGPVFPISLTRMEMDPYTHGRLVAEASLRRLHGGEFPSDIVLKPVYKVGDSFR